MSVILEQCVNCFGNFGAECHLLKIGYSESSFTKNRGCQCNLPKYITLSACNISLTVFCCFNLYLLCQDVSLVMPTLHDLEL
jgi:hypothetical protein